MAGSEADGRPRFITDNTGFDWQFINGYYHPYHPVDDARGNAGALLAMMNGMGLTIRR